MVTVFSCVNKNYLMLSLEFQREICYHKYEEWVLGACIRRRMFISEVFQVQY